MKRYWRFWATTFALMTLLLVAMSWLTIEAWRGDRMREQAESDAELEKKVSIALWRIDSLFAPILAREATYPPRVYRKFAEGNPSGNSMVPDDFVLFRFHWPNQTSMVSQTASHSSMIVVDTEDHRKSLINRTNYSELAQQTPFELTPQPDSSLGPSTANGNTLVLGGLNVGGSNTFTQSTSNLKSKNRGDIDARMQGLESQAVQQRAAFNINGTEYLPTDELGATAPIWSDDWLMLVRRVKIDSMEALQGCRLDWDAMRSKAAESIQDIFPNVDFVPTKFSEEYGARQLAGLPVELVVPPASRAARWTALKVAVLGGWCAMLGALGMMLAFTVGALRLDEKRSSFVSAVTHELRTPLTTFRMYADMLNRDMVPAESRKVYLETLLHQSDRLCHLIDNVLTFARLERGRQAVANRNVTMDELLHDMLPRLALRCQQAGMQFVLEVDESMRNKILTTDPDCVEQILSNLIDNSCKYAKEASDKRIWLRIEGDPNEVRFRVIDHGPGIASDVRRRLFQAFSKSAEQAALSQPGVGLGLALSQRIAKQLHGRLECLPTATGCEMVLSWHCGYNRR
jgi:signal transduction histidine kinase